MSELDVLLDMYRPSVRGGGVSQQDLNELSRSVFETHAAVVDLARRLDSFCSEVSALRSEFKRVLDAVSDLSSRVSALESSVRDVVSALKSSSRSSRSGRSTSAGISLGKRGILLDPGGDDD